MIAKNVNDLIGASIKQRFRSKKVNEKKKKKKRKNNDGQILISS